MRNLRQIFVVLLLLFISTTATAQSQSDNTQTKAVSATKADVNGDGVVNEADIAEILAIMKNAGGIAEQPKYYWYAGWTEPTAENIAEIVNEMYPKAKDSTELNPAGFTSTTLAGHEINFTTNPIYDQDGRNNHPEGKKYYYVVIPSGHGIQNTTTNAFEQGDTGIWSLVRTFDNHNVYKSIQAPTYIIQGIKLCEIK